MKSNSEIVKFLKSHLQMVTMTLASSHKLEDSPEVTALFKTIAPVLGVGHIYLQHSEFGIRGGHVGEILVTYNLETIAHFRVTETGKLHTVHDDASEST